MLAFSNNNKKKSRSTLLIAAWLEEIMKVRRNMVSCLTETAMMEMRMLGAEEEEDEEEEKVQKEVGEIT